MVSIRKARLTKEDIESFVETYKSAYRGLEEYAYVKLYKCCNGGSYSLVIKATMLNYTKDNTMDIAIKGDTPGHIYLFDGSNGSLLKDLTFDAGRYIQEIAE